MSHYSRQTFPIKNLNLVAEHNYKVGELEHEFPLWRTITPSSQVPCPHRKRIHITSINHRAKDH